MSSSLFAQLRSEMESGGAAAALDRLIEELRREKSYRELFEAMRLRLRLELGLPLLEEVDDAELSEETRRKLDAGLIAACREVGQGLMEQGELRDGWLYLRAAGDKSLAAKLLSDIDVNEENLDDFVEVALQEGVNAGEGFRLVLDHYGTCNAITAFETQMAGAEPADQQAAASMLVKSLHEDLLGEVNTDIATQSNKEPEGDSLEELVADRDWLFTDESYHIDTTHLSSVVRFARLVDDDQTVRLALDLTHYGRRLAAPFQTQDEEPFADYYPAHALYFQAVLGENADEAVSYFRERAEKCEPETEGTLPIEVYIALLDRMGRYEDASAATLDLIPPGVPTMGIMPSLYTLCLKSGDFTPLIELCERNDDLLGFVTGLVESKQTAAGTGA